MERNRRFHGAPPIARRNWREGRVARIPGRPRGRLCQSGPDDRDAVERGPQGVQSPRPRLCRAAGAKERLLRLGAGSPCLRAGIGRFARGRGSRRGGSTPQANRKGLGPAAARLAARDRADLCRQSPARGFPLSRARTEPRLHALDSDRHARRIGGGATEVGRPPFFRSIPIVSASSTLCSAAGRSD
jgi:hypothetical protein